MHKVVTPSAKRRLGALFRAAADPDSGVTHIATTAIETVLTSDDEDTIMRAMFDAADQMAANGRPLDLDPPAPEPATPERAPRDDADDDSTASPTGAEELDDQETTEAKALIKELEEFRVSRFDQTSNFGKVTITGDNGNTKEITVASRALQRARAGPSTRDRAAFGGQRARAIVSGASPPHRSASSRGRANALLAYPRWFYAQ